MSSEEDDFDEESVGSEDGDAGFFECSDSSGEEEQGAPEEKSDDAEKQPVEKESSSESADDCNESDEANSEEGEAGFFDCDGADAEEEPMKEKQQKEEQQKEKQQKEKQQKEKQQKEKQQKEKQQKEKQQKEKQQKEKHKGKQKKREKKKKLGKEAEKTLTEEEMKNLDPIARLQLLSAGGPFPADKRLQANKGMLPRAKSAKGSIETAKAQEKPSKALGENCNNSGGNGSDDDDDEMKRKKRKKKKKLSRSNSGGKKGGGWQLARSPKAGRRKSKVSTYGSLPAPITMGGRSRTGAMGAANALSPRAYAKSMRMRSTTIEEIVATEEAYLADMETLMTVFRKPIEKYLVIPPNEVANIFSNLTMLIGINQQLLLDLQKALQDGGDDATIAPIFLRLADYLKAYAIYCNNQQAAFNAVDRCRKKFPAFAKFLDDQMTNPKCKGLQFISFLIKPVQRICKYPLLLREVVKHTPNLHSDKRLLTEAWEKINTTVKTINESKRAAENVKTMIQLQGKIVNGDKLGLLTASRRWLDTAVFQDLRKGKDGTYRDPTAGSFLLFTDLLIYCRKPSRKTLLLKGGSGYEYEVHAWMPLHLVGAKLVDEDPDRYLGMHFPFNLKHLGGGNTYLLFASTAAERSRWLDLLVKHRNACLDQRERKRMSSSSPSSSSSAIEKL